MSRAKANGIELEYDTFGEPSGAPLLLIAGLGMQMIGWDVEFCEMLATRGFHVIRFDNRDSGLSTDMAGRPQYTLEDMADDAVALLDVLGIASAHIVGASMGGFIAQVVALRHPERVLTLTSMISGPNGEDHVQPTAEAIGVLLAPRPATREEQVAAGLLAKRALLGPKDPYDEEWERPRIERSVDRAYNPAGFMRQFAAITAAEGRLKRLRELRVPTLVIHGDADILVPVENGRNVAAAVPGARLVEIEGMGHDVPRRVWATVADEIAALARQSATSC